MLRPSICSGTSGRGPTARLDRQVWRREGCRRPARQPEAGPRRAASLGSVYRLPLRNLLDRGTPPDIDIVGEFGRLAQELSEYRDHLILARHRPHDDRSDLPVSEIT